MNLTTEFKKYIAPALIGGLCLIIAAVVPMTCNNTESKLVTKEITETRSPDGTITKRHTENYR